MKAARIVGSQERTLLLIPICWNQVTQVTHSNCERNLEKEKDVHDCKNCIHTCIITSLNQLFIHEIISPT